MMENLRQINPMLLNTRGSRLTLARCRHDHEQDACIACTFNEAARQEALAQRLS